MYGDATVTSILQPGNALTDDGDDAFCAAPVTLALQFLTNFHWTYSMLQPEEIACIEDLLVECHAMFARRRFNIGMNVDFNVKVTPKDDSPAYSQNLLTPINLEEEIRVANTPISENNNVCIFRTF